MYGWFLIPEGALVTVWGILVCGCLFCVSSRPSSAAQAHGPSLSKTGSSQIDSTERAPFSRLAVQGDSRFRFENNARRGEGSVRNHLVFRARLGAVYAINDQVSGGFRLATGSSDNPNSTDVTLSDFSNDFGVSLDRAFLQYAGEKVSLMGGKFENPFLSTDLVWDGDVNPQGAAGTVAGPHIAGIQPTIVGLFHLIDEDPEGSNSVMGGGQLVLRSTRTGPFWIIGGVGYYDYEINSLETAGPGDVRSNRLNAEETAFRSDFNLVDILARVTYDGAGPRWPMQVTLNYVHNAGAVDGENDGFRVAVQAGRGTERGDVRLHYGYSRVETEAVLAAFSNDNITRATNYRQHAVTADYVVLPATRLNLTWYLYRPIRPEAPEGADDLRSRLRLNLSVSF